MQRASPPPAAESNDPGSPAGTCARSRCLRTTCTPSTVPLVMTNCAAGSRAASSLASASADRLSPTLDPCSHTQCLPGWRDGGGALASGSPSRGPSARSNPRTRLRSRCSSTMGDSASVVISSAAPSQIRVSGHTHARHSLDLRHAAALTRKQLPRRHEMDNRSPKKSGWAVTPLPVRLAARRRGEWPNL